MVAETNSRTHRPKLGALLHSEAMIFPRPEDDNNCNSHSAMNPRLYCNNLSTTPTPTGELSPNFSSPWNQPSPYAQSPWIIPSPVNGKFTNYGLIGSVVREEGHVYSLAASGDLLYTGSDSKNIRVWKNLKEFTGFKSNSGLVKAIVIHGNKIFTGHQDGKIRIWKISSRNTRVYKQIGSLPTFKDYIKSSVNPKNYVEVRRHRNVLRIKHFDAVSCLSLNEEAGLLYSGSWDKTLKVWRVSDYKCVESVHAHEDAINSVAAGFHSLVFTGSADGTVKAWKGELQGRGTKHFLVQTLLKQESAVTALAVNEGGAVLYCGSSNGLVNFWEHEKHLSHGGILRGHKVAVLCLATAGNLVFSGSADKSICVWRREVGGVHTCLTVLTGHSGPVKCLAVEEDNECDDNGNERWILYSGSLDKSVKVWRVSDNPTELRVYESPRVSCYSSVYPESRQRTPSRLKYEVKITN